jgi:ketosteroid isomerase-like protein
MTATRTNADTIGGIYAAFGRGDIPAILATLADDVMWEDWRRPSSAQRAGVPHLVARRGPDEVADFFRVIGGWAFDEFQVLDVIGAGRQVAAEVVARWSMPNGGRVADEEIHLWTFDDAGKVARFRHYCDTARHIAAAAGEDTTTG